MSDHYQPTQEELDHMGAKIDGDLRETYATLYAGKCMYCDCQKLNNSGTPDMCAACGHPADVHSF
jgi:hypothetical protein